MHYSNCLFFFTYHYNHFIRKYSNLNFNLLSIYYGNFNKGFLKLNGNYHFFLYSIIIFIYFYLNYFKFILNSVQLVVFINSFKFYPFLINYLFYSYFINLIIEDFFKNYKNFNSNFNLINLLKNLIPNCYNDFS
jgi:hypothetical protein